MKLKVYTCLYFFIKISLYLLSIFCLVYNALLLRIFNYVVFHIISQSFFSPLYLCVIFLTMPHGMWGIETVHAAVEARSLNHWTTSEVPFKKKVQSNLSVFSFFLLSWILGFSSCLVRFSSLHLYQRLFSSILPIIFIFPCKELDTT